MCIPCTSQFTQLQPWPCLFLQVKKTQIPWEKLPSNLSDSCFDLLKGCLQTSSRHRISLKSLSAHPWLASESWAECCRGNACTCSARRAHWQQRYYFRFNLNLSWCRTILYTVTCRRPCEACFQNSQHFINQLYIKCYQVIFSYFC